MTGYEFEREARELADTPYIERHLDEEHRKHLAMLVGLALRRAYEAGARDMKERILVEIEKWDNPPAAIVDMPIEAPSPSVMRRSEVPGDEPHDGRESHL